MSDTPQRGYLRSTPEGLKPRDDLTARPALRGTIARPANAEAPVSPVTPDLDAQAVDTGGESEEKLASSMVVAVSMPDASEREKAILAALNKGSSAYPTFAKRYGVVGSKPIAKDPPQFRVYLQTGSPAIREDGAEAAAKAMLGEILVTSGIRLRDSEYIAVLLPLADKKNPKNIAATAANQWTYHEAFQQNAPKAVLNNSEPA